MAEWIDLVEMGLDVARGFALDRGRRGGFEGYGDYGGAITPISYGHRPTGGGGGGGGGGMMPTACPPARPRMPGAVVYDNPCSPGNPTVFYNGGSVSSLLSPKVLANQARKLARANRVVPKKAVRRKKGR